GETPSETAGELRNTRILVVDDNEDTRDVVGAVLQRYGAQVATVASADEAMQALDASSYDILVCDIAMPGEDGYSLIKRIRALPPEQGGRIPALAFTAYARGEDSRRALIAGFQAHLPKPVDPALLAMTVAQLRDQSSSLGPSVIDL